MSKAKTSKKNNIIIILLIVLVLALIAIVAVLLLKKEEPAARTSDESSASVSTVNDGNAPVLTYEQGAVALDEDSLQKQYDEMVEKAKEGTVALEYKNTAISSDGINFDCHIENSLKNESDMYLNIFKDSTLSEQILLTGLIRPGEGINSFESEIKLAPGTYEAVLVQTQVKDDHSTIKAQVSVVLNLVVEE